MLSAYHWSEAELARLDLQAAFSWQVLGPVLASVGLVPGASVADVGCGPGGLSRRLAATVGPTGRVVGVDLDPRLIARAGQLPPAAGSAPIRWLQGDARELPLPEGSQDVVLLHAVLQHVPRPEEAIAACLRALRPGGALVVVDADDALLRLEPPVPEITAFVARTAALQAAFGGDREVGRRLAGLLHAAGLQDVTIATAFWTTPPHGAAVFAATTLLPRAELLPDPEREAARRDVGERFAAHAEAGGFAQFGSYTVTGRKR